MIGPERDIKANELHDNFGTVQRKNRRILKGKVFTFIRFINIASDRHMEMSVLRNRLHRLPLSILTSPRMRFFLPKPCFGYVINIYEDHNANINVHL